MSANRPLYKQTTEPSLGEDGHAGLWFDKFCDQWEQREGFWSMKSKDGPNRKHLWLKSLVGATRGAVGVSAQIEETKLRYLRLLDGCRGRFQVFESDSRFVTGLGRPHPIENGFAWHPTLGTPYLPGTSVKGLVRAWAHEQGVDSETLGRLLGSGGPDKRTAGALCFLDAIPVMPVRVEVDVLTPHYGGWSETEPPGDWRSPTPIPFLVTAPRAKFLFGIIPSKRTLVEITPAETDEALAWLGEALGWSGAGAKTAVGYGRFERNESSTSDCEGIIANEARERRRANANTPEQRWRLLTEECDEKALLDLVRVHLEKHAIEDEEERKGFIAAIEASGFVDNWQRGKTSSAFKPMPTEKKIKARARLLRPPR